MVLRSLPAVNDRRPKGITNALIQALHDHQQLRQRRVKLVLLRARRPASQQAALACQHMIGFRVFLTFIPAQQAALACQHIRWMLKGV